MRSAQRLALHLVCMVAIFSVGCSDDEGSPTGAGGGVKGATVTFDLIPSVPVGTAMSQAIPLTHCFEWHCIDTTAPSCHTNVFIDCGDVTGDFFSYASNSTSCWPFTVLILDKAGYSYDMSGTVLRPLGNGSSTPFASGTYTKIELGGGGGFEGGTFTFHEGALTISNNVICPSAQSKAHPHY